MCQGRKPRCSSVELANRRSCRAGQPRWKVKLVIGLMLVCDISGCLQCYAIVQCLLMGVWLAVAHLRVTSAKHLSIASGLRQYSSRTSSNRMLQGVHWNTSCAFTPADRALDAAILRPVAASGICWLLLPRDTPA